MAEVVIVTGARCLFYDHRLKPLEILLLRAAHEQVARAKRRPAELALTMAHL